jgi:hypothetical protein
VSRDEVLGRWMAGPRASGGVCSPWPGVRTNAEIADELAISLST